jgi:hypothetical protein
MTLHSLEMLSSNDRKDFSIHLGLCSDSDRYGRMRAALLTPQWAPAGWTYCAPWIGKEHSDSSDYTSRGHAYDLPRSALAYPSRWCPAVRVHPSQGITGPCCRHGPATCTTAHSGRRGAFGREECIYTSMEAQSRANCGCESRLPGLVTCACVAAGRSGVWLNPVCRCVAAERGIQQDLEGCGSREGFWMRREDHGVKKGRNH